MEKRSLCCRGSHVRRFIEKLLKMPKKAKTKLTSDNHQWKSLFLIHLPTSSKIFCNWMFFSFVSLITNRGFFLIWLGNSLWLRVWRHDELKDDAGIYFYDSNFGGRWPRSVGRGPWKIKTRFAAVFYWRHLFISISWEFCKYLTPI